MTDTKSTIITMIVIKLNIILILYYY